MKISVSAESRIVRAISFGVFSPLRALDEGDHAIEEGLPRIGGNADFDDVREDTRPAGDRAAIAARLPHYGRGFTGDGRFIDRCRTLDDLSITRNEFAGLHPAAPRRAAARAAAAAPRRACCAAAAAVLAQFIRGDLLGRAVLDPIGEGLRARLAQGIRLGLAAAFGHGFGEVGEDDREPQPGG